MVKVFTNTLFEKPDGSDRRYGFFMDRALKHNLDEYLIKGVKQGHDGIILVTGLEGTGKSTFTQAIAAYCDRTHKLELSRVVFSGRDLMRAIDDAPPESALIFDEAIMDMSSQDFATEMQKILIKKFTLIRKKRLYIFIVIPSIFMLRKYFAIFRTRAMINCYCPDGITRGYFRFYSFATKKKLFLKGYREMDMGAVKPDFIGRFVDTYGFFVNADAYEAKKDEAIRKLTEEDEDENIQLKQSFEDYKQKIKVDVEKYKAKWKDKFGEQRAKYMLQLQELRKQYAEKFDEVKEQSITLQKSSDKKKIASLQQETNKLLAYTYDILVQQAKRVDPDKPFSINNFTNILQSKGIMNASILKMKEMIDDGNGLLLVEKSLTKID